MRKIAYPINIKKSDFNTNNIHENDPYIIGSSCCKPGELILDKSWWNSLTPYIQKLLNERLNGQYIFDTVTIPHEIQYDERLAIVHQSFQQGYDYNVWYGETKSAPQGVKMILISESEKIALHVKDKPHLKELRQKIADILNENTGGQYFIRTSSTSGKNEKPTKPFDQPDEILEH